MKTIVQEEKIYPAFKKNNIPVVLAANDEFCPYMAVMIRSIMDHASDENNYDIIVLHRNIGGDNQKLLNSMAEGRANIMIRFYDARPLIDGYDFYTANRSDFTIDAYLRLLIPYILSDEYEKAIYVDGDMVAMTDIAGLYAEDLDGYLLASSRDMCGIAAYYDPKDTRKAYRDECLEVDAPDDYFISGMLVFNLNEFRASFTMDFILKFSTTKNWMQHDQDVLNVLCKGGRAKMLHAAWDVMEIYKPEVLPVNLYTELMESIAEPKIIHYGGCNKPWKTMRTHNMDVFWDTAVRTPFYKNIIYRIIAEKERIFVTGRGSGLGGYHDLNEEMVARFRNGKVGFRYIIKFAIAWLKYKIKKYK